jgi:hypothetical protein
MNMAAWLPSIHQLEPEGYRSGQRKFPPFWIATKQVNSNNSARWRQVGLVIGKLQLFDAIGQQVIALKRM